MKLNSKEEEDAQFNAVLKGSAIGGTAGLILGIGGIYAAARKSPLFRGLTIPTRAFLLTSTTTFGAIFYAERLSNDLHRTRDPRRTYQMNRQRATETVRENKTNIELFKEWRHENRYRIVCASWLASMVVALALVNRSPASTSQKLVQARVYAQGITLAVLIAMAALEVNDARKGQSRWETVMVVDPSDPEHRKLIEKKIHKEEYTGQDLWMDMVQSEERRLANRKSADKAGKT